MRKSLYFCAVVLCLSFAQNVLAQDPVKVDPKHYTVVSENDKVRILKVHYGPHEKSVMHYHPDSVAIPLTDYKSKFTLADGKTMDMTGKKGEAAFAPAGLHQPENPGDTGFDLILVELKGKSAAKPATAAKTKPAASAMDKPKK
jgi:hypothetical protein